MEVSRNIIFRCEGKKVKRSVYLRALIVGPFFVAMKLVVFLTFVPYVFLGRLLTAQKVFLTVSIYQAIRLSVTLFIPFAFQCMSETLVTIRRQEVSWLHTHCHLKRVKYGVRHQMFQGISQNDKLKVGSTL